MLMTSLSARVQFIIYFPSQPTMLDNSNLQVHTRLRYHFSSGMKHAYIMSIVPLRGVTHNLKSFTNSTHRKSQIFIVYKIQGMTIMFAS